MLGGKNKQSLGYTIVEVMIVLAISGIMFLIAATFIQGKQEKSSFKAGVNGMASQIQDVIEQVTDGRYSDIPITCTFNGTATNPNQVAGGSHQGENSSCVFLGKMVHFSGAIPSHNFQVFSLAGGRLDSSHNPITSLSTADPQVIDSLTTSQVTPDSLDVINSTVHGASGSSTSFTFGFIQSLGSASTSGGSPDLQNGGQSIGIYYDGNNNASASNPAYSGSSAHNFQTANSVDVCLTDGTQYADILIGTDSTGFSTSPLSVNVQMDGSVRPAIC